MPRKYIRQIPSPTIMRERGLAGTTAAVRFYQFYNFLVQFCKEVKVILLNQTGSKVRYRLQLIY